MDVFAKLKSLLAGRQRERAVRFMPLSEQLYRDGVKDVCKNLDLLTTELQRRALVTPWSFSETCRTRKERGDDYDVMKCNYVIPILCGLIFLYAREPLRKSLLAPLLDADEDAGPLTAMKDRELAKFEAEAFEDAFVPWWCELNLDWLAGKLQVRQLVIAYEKSGAKLIIPRTMQETEAAFLSEDCLRKNTEYGRCVIEYLCHPVQIAVNSLVEGFVSEMVRRHKMSINCFSLFSKKLRIE